MLAHFVLVLPVGAKNIPNHNNYVPLGQLRDLTGHKNYHEYPIYLYTLIEDSFKTLYTCLFKVLCLILGHLCFSFLTYFRKVNSV